MFDNLLSALPYNPSIIHQLSFYAKRIRKEKAVRKVGIVFIVLAFLIQFFAFVSPPQPTLAYSPNDLVNGGFSNAQEAYNACAANLKDNVATNGSPVGYGDVLANYGISCAEVKAARTITLNSDSYNKTLYSMGSQPYDLAGETPVNIDTATYYIRYLWAWDSSGTSSNYQALVVRSSSGQLMFLLYPCGNLVAVGVPIPVKPVTPPKPPKKPTTPVPCSGVISSVDFTACVTTTKSAIDITQNSINADGITAQANDLIRYNLYAKNNGTGVVKDYVFSDSLAYVLDYAHIAVLGTGKVNTATQQIIYPVRNIGPGQTASVYFEVRVNSPIPQTPPSPSDPNYFNMEMVNTYGKTIVIHLPLTPTQTIENVTNSTNTNNTAAVLPNTGPGTGFMIAAVITAIAGFFFYRSRLLAKESVIAIKENSGAI